MVTHGSSYKLLRNLDGLNEPTIKLSREDEMQVMRAKLKDHIAQAYENNAKQYNLRSRQITYKVGDEIFRRNFAQSSQIKKFNAKLAPLYIKAKVKEKVGSHYYVLQDLDSNNIGTYHAKDMRP
ncbi:uncharacterized protein [Musca autumnalis]|uniref:uncharacterized protein n=1 Tax=Musca autumnalis TaxID=221902 RepID=UPI003CF90843